MTLKTCNLSFNFAAYFSVKKILTTSLLLLCSEAWSLVDYTPKPSFTPRNSGAQRVVKKKVSPSRRSKTSRTSISRTSQSAPHKRSGIFSTDIFYQNDNIKLGESSGNISRMGVSTHFETPYNIYLDGRYSQAKLSSHLSDNSNYQSGNPEVMLGLNWLEFGNSMEEAHIDFLAGVSFGQKNSAYATERTDKIMGISTAKRFYDFALGLGYQFILTGTPGNSELSIGPISKITASLGWVVSQDIRFLVEANSYSIGSSTDSLRVNRLEEDVKVSVLTPQLILGISPLVDLTLGSHLSTRRLKSNQLLGAKLWNYDGMYGNALYVKMGINL